MQGNFNQIFLSAQKFGVPAQLKSHGITTLYQGENETGWDGQFYYYIANDPLALKDTTQHIDLNAYRYQRIGLPALAKFVSKIARRNWVSPLFYYMTSLLVILMAASMAATFFQKRKISPYLALFWALGCGTQVTQLNGLPDAAADGFLIIALISLIDKHVIVYMITMTLAVLTREVYVIFPILIAFVTFIVEFNSNKTSLFTKNKLPALVKALLIQAIPVALFVTWQAYVLLKIGTMSSPENIISWPFVTTFHYLLAGLSGVHPDIGAGWSAYLEGVGISLYLILLALSTMALLPLLKRSTQNITRGIALGFLALIALYFCFGPLVMKHFTGYFKAANIFLFALPFAATLTQTKMSRPIIFLLLIITLFFNYLLWIRITVPPYQPTPSISYVASEPNCLKEYRAQIQPIDIETYATASIMKRLFAPRKMIIQTKVTNTSSETYSRFLGKGRVNMSYQWVKADNQVAVKDGIRTQLTKSLLPNESTILPITVDFPSEAGKYFLTLSLVQEGCGWVYANQIGRAS